MWSGYVYYREQHSRLYGKINVFLNHMSDISLHFPSGEKIPSHKPLINVKMVSVRPTESVVFFSFLSSCVWDC